MLAVLGYRCIFATDYSTVHLLFTAHELETWIQPPPFDLLEAVGKGRPALEPVEQRQFRRKRPEALKVAFAIIEISGLE